MRRDTLLLLFVSLLIHRGHFEATQFLHMVVHPRTHLLRVVYPAEHSTVERQCCVIVGGRKFYP